MHCRGKIAQSERERFFHYYYALPNITKKREFIDQSMELIIPKYSYKKDGSQRSSNYAYIFIVSNKRIRVCKQFFLNTLDIGLGSIATATAKFLHTTDTGLVAEDRRGKNPKIKHNQELTN